MPSLIKILLFTCCSLTCMIGSCDGCSCQLPSNIQESFCASKYAALIKVTKSLSPSLSSSLSSSLSPSSTSSQSPSSHFLSPSLSSSPSPSSSSSVSSFPPSLSSSHSSTSFVNLSKVLPIWESLRTNPGSFSSSFHPDSSSSPLLSQSSESSEVSEDSEIANDSPVNSEREIEGTSLRRRKRQSIKLARQSIKLARQSISGGNSNNRKEIDRSTSGGRVESIDSNKRDDRESIRRDVTGMDGREESIRRDGIGMDGRGMTDDERGHRMYQMYQTYQVRIEKLFKSSSEAEKSSLLRSSLISVRRRKTSCDSDLKESHIYIIYGDIERDGSVIVNLCHAIPLHSLDTLHITQLMRIDKEGLECR